MCVLQSYSSENDITTKPYIDNKVMVQCDIHDGERDRASGPSMNDTYNYTVYFIKHKRI